MEVLPDDFLAHGGDLSVAPSCAKNRGLGEADLLDGVRFADAREVVRLLSEHPDTVAMTM